MPSESSSQPGVDLTMAALVDRFGRNPLEQPVFYNNPHALRFQLDPGTGANADPTWRWAVLDRIRAVARWAFADSQDIHVVSPRWVAPQAGTDPGGMSGEKLLRRAGFAAPARLMHLDPPESGEEFATQWFTARSSTPLADVDRIVWLAFVEPRRKRRYDHLTYFVDIRAGLLLFPYDVRGMDLVAAEAATLLPAYRAFQDWLLEYDRPAMALAMAKVSDAPGSATP